MEKKRWNVRGERQEHDWTLETVGWNEPLYRRLERGIT